MKKFKLTLVELLISMALFSLMLSVLIKAFQMASETSERQIQVMTLNELALVSLNLISDDLDSVDHGELRSYFKLASGSSYDPINNVSAYGSLNKSANFYFDADNNDVRFFTESVDSSKVTAIQYIYTAEDGLVRYSKDYEKTIDASSGQSIEAAYEAALSDTVTYPFAYYGNDSNGDPKVLPDLKTLKANDNSIDESPLLLGTKSTSTLVPQITENSFELGILFSVDESVESSGFSKDVANYTQGQLPDALIIKFTLNELNNESLSRTYSRKIPITTLDFFGSDI